MSARALAMLWERADGVYFKEHPTRRFHIRVAYQGELKGEFWTLGEHAVNRRRIILCRVDYEMKPLPDNRVLKIPFLVFADESIEDTDDVLFPVVRDLMLEALRQQKTR